MPPTYIYIIVFVWRLSFLYYIETKIPENTSKILEFLDSGPHHTDTPHTRQAPAPAPALAPTRRPATYTTHVFQIQICVQVNVLSPIVSLARVLERVSGHDFVFLRGESVSVALQWGLIRIPAHISECARQMLRMLPVCVLVLVLMLVLVWCGVCRCGVDQNPRIQVFCRYFQVFSFQCKYFVGMFRYFRFNVGILRVFLSIFVSM